MPHFDSGKSRNLDFDDADEVPGLSRATEAVDDLTFR